MRGIPAFIIIHRSTWDIDNLYAIMSFRQYKHRNVSDLVYSDESEDEEEATSPTIEVRTVII